MISALWIVSTLSLRGSGALAIRYTVAPVASCSMLLFSLVVYRPHYVCVAGAPAPQV